MVAVHARTMATRPEAAMVLGSAPWEKPAQPTVFDVLLAETPMVFFYNALEAGKFYDFRHAWTLNLSVRRKDFVQCGGFAKELRPVYYEDLALGYQLLGPDRKGILYEPAAQVEHRHPTTLEQYLDREELLGLMTPVLARVSPGAFLAIHGVLDIGAMAKAYQGWVKMDGASHRWIFTRLAEWAKMPEAAIAGLSPAERERMLMTIYQMHVPLKRLAFRLGFLRGMELMADARWEERRAAGLWRTIL